MPEQRRPESADLTDYEVLDASDTLDGDPGDDPLDRGVAAPQRWSAAIRYGSTAEQQAGESLDQLLAEEEPDVAGEEDDEPTGNPPATRTPATRTSTGCCWMTARIPGRAGWWPRMRAPTPTRRRISSRATSGSMVAVPPRRKRRCTSWTTTTPTSASQPCAARRSSCAAAPGRPTVRQCVAIHRSRGSVVGGGQHEMELALADVGLQLAQRRRRDRAGEPADGQRLQAAVVDEHRRQRGGLRREQVGRPVRAASSGGIGGLPGPVCR